MRRIPYHRDVTRHALLAVALFCAAADLPAQTFRPLEFSPDVRSLRGSLADSAKDSPQAAASAGAQDQVVARVVCGEGWETVIVLFNMGNAPLDFRQFFMNSEGNPMPVAFRAYPDEQAGTAAVADGTLNPGSSLSITVFAADGAYREGWSAIVSGSGRKTLGGYALVRHRVRALQFETTIPFSTMQDFSVYLPFDNTQGFRTHLTLVNPASNLAADVRLTYLSFTGEVLLIDSLVIKPGQQTTIVVPNAYPDLANKIGTVSVEANINRFSTFGLRYNELSGVVASLPALAPAYQ